MFYCLDTPHLFFLFIHPWTGVASIFCLLQKKKSFCTHSVRIPLQVPAISSLGTPRGEIAGPGGDSMFNSLSKLSDRLPQQLHHFTCHQQRMVPISPYPQQSVVSLCFYYKHPNECEVIAHGGFDLHFPDN